MTKPWATIQKAAGAISAGDTVHVGAGTYDERVTIGSSKSGAADATTKFIADGAVVVGRGFVVASSYTELSGFEVTPGSSTIAYNSGGQVSIVGNHNTLTGFNVHDTLAGCAFTFEEGSSYNSVIGFECYRPQWGGAWFFSGANHNTLSHGTIRNHGGGEAVLLYGSDNTVDTVTIQGIGGWRGGGVDGDGIKPSGSNLTIRNCVIHDIWPYSAGAHADAIQFWLHNSNLVIENNRLGSWQNGGLGSTPDCDACIMMAAEENVDVTVRNNVFIGGSYYPINVNTGGPGVLTLRLYNNTFWTYGPPRVEGLPGAIVRNNIFRAGNYVRNSPGASSDYNLYLTQDALPGDEPHSVVGDPLLTDPDASAETRFGVDADYSLTASSAAIGHGDPAYSSPTDITGAPRDGAPDIGAYEYGARTGSAIPTRLSSGLRAPVAYGDKAAIAGSLTSQSGSPLPGEKVMLEVLAGAVWTAVASAITGVGGSFALYSSALTSAQAMRVTFSGDATCLATTGGALRVAPMVSLGRPVSVSTMRRARAYVVGGSLSPRHKAGTNPVAIQTYHYEHRRWVLKRTFAAKARNYMSYTQYRANVKLAVKGSWRLRAYYPAAAFAATYSSWRSVRVR